MAELTPEDFERRLRAKRANERLKLLATTMNTLGMTVVGVAVLVPVVAGAAGLLSLIWIVIAVVLHLAAQVALGSLRSED
ncbi:hypothetical protein IHQ68_09865 [Chelatococcus sambhunathii]|uniref:Uncharacterized protein n=1 Tax=Chelatococcus sambhunathii TaxID=363953 RepID=A0ABU1DFL9_9HYPH|nr:hypothetical protein [Chelatococcus sambhunathii]MDR4306923.1 hypothetical protein [Chelatococcus sambhunathii]